MSSSRPIEKPQSCVTKECQIKVEEYAHFPQHLFYNPEVSMNNLDAPDIESDCQVKETPKRQRTSNNSRDFEGEFPPDPQTLADKSSHHDWTKENSGESNPGVHLEKGSNTTCKVEELSQVLNYNDSIAKCDTSDEESDWESSYPRVLNKIGYDSTKSMITEPSRKRSQVWEYFDPSPPNKVQCLLCRKNLMYNNNTSSMLRHLRAKHENLQPCPTIIGTKKEELDSVLVDFVVQDIQPYNVVSGSGFRAFVTKLDPTYLIPSQQMVKSMVEKRYLEERGRVKLELMATDSVSLTADMWTTVDKNACLAVTCHYVNAEDEIKTTLLGVHSFPPRDTGEDIAASVQQLIKEWEITKKIRCVVIDGTENMIEMAKILKLRHVVCLAHALNVTVTKSIEATSGLDDIRSRAHKIVAYFSNSTSAMEKLQQLQVQMGRQVVKLIMDVDTRWISSYEMLQRLFEQREPVAAALATLPTDLVPLTAIEYEEIAQCIKMLSPFQAAAIELSEQQRVSGSKVIPLITMLQYTLDEMLTLSTNDMAIELGHHLKRILTDKLANVETTSDNPLATLLDPRFKTFGFHNPTNCDAAVKRLKNDCAALMRGTTNTTDPEPSTSFTSMKVAAASTGFNLWRHLDIDTENKRKSGNTAANASIEVQRYLAIPPLQRTEDPLEYWKAHKTVYPNLYKLAKQFLVTPASTVPCEWVFSKAGDVVSRKRNCLSPSTAQRLLFLNKNPLSYTSETQYLKHSPKQSSSERR